MLWHLQQKERNLIENIQTVLTTSEKLFSNLKDAKIGHHGFIIGEKNHINYDY